ncbi:hypothetical protein Leryth_018623 [Lithospermum erythrorhizon]|nr:hypothetical protein Leryth_018623 [Lithospermum erythrorhizon]
MLPFRRCTRILILSCLTLSVFVPIVLLSHRLKNLNSDVSKEFGEDLSIIKHRTEAQALSALEEDDGELLQEPSREVYKDVGFNSEVSLISSGEDDRRILSESVSRSSDEANRGSESGNTMSTSDDENKSSESGKVFRRSDEENRNSESIDVLHSSDEEKRSESMKVLSSPDKEKSENRLRAFDEDNSSNESRKSTEDVSLSNKNGTSNDKVDKLNTKEGDLHTLQQEKYPGKKDQQNHGSHRARDEKVKEIKDQILRAKVYMKFVPPGNNSQFVKELRLRIKELDHALGGSSKDSDLPRRAPQKMKAMEATLVRANKLYPDCEAMSKKLRAMTYSTEEQVRAQKDQTTFLFQLAGRTTPKGLHCLSMRLTSEFFALLSDDRELPNQHKLNNPSLYHFSVFSDNVLACAVVVNSTVSAAQEPEKIVFHIVTDSLNLPAMTMWFLLNTPEKATVHVQSIDNFGWLSVKYEANLPKEASLDLRFTSPLNHLRFYLPDVFPRLDKIVFLDHDVVVRRDLKELWELNMKGKVNGAVETCQKGEPSYRRMDMFINFTDPVIAKKFDANTCTWAFGMNVFDLQKWRKQDLTQVYHKYLAMGSEGPLMKAGTLPIGWMTFYNQTVALDRRFHVFGLGHDHGVKHGEIEQASVLHFDGIMKPWLDIGIDAYKRYWKKYVNYHHPFLQQCNIQE